MLIQLLSCRLCSCPVFHLCFSYPVTPQPHPSRFFLFPGMTQLQREEARKSKDCSNYTGQKLRMERQGRENAGIAYIVANISRNPSSEYLESRNLSSPLCTNAPFLVSGFDRDLQANDRYSFRLRAFASVIALPNRSVDPSNRALVQRLLRNFLISTGQCPPFAIYISNRRYAKRVRFCTRGCMRARIWYFFFEANIIFNRLFTR